MIFIYRKLYSDYRSMGWLLKNVYPTYLKSHFSVWFYQKMRSQPMKLKFNPLKSLSHCNWTWTHNHLVHKQTLNHLAKRASKWVNGWVFVLWAKWLWARVQLNSENLKVDKMSFLAFNQIILDIKIFLLVFSVFIIQYNDGRIISRNVA